MTKINRYRDATYDTMIVKVATDYRTVGFALKQKLAMKRTTQPGKIRRQLSISLTTLKVTTQQSRLVCVSSRF